jgi:secretion/DNA translocation related CpaE-like protein
MTSESTIGVLSGCGGAGASVLAAVLAGCAAEREGRAFLIDCDPLGGGIDVLLGREEVAGVRWGQVRLRGGRLDPAALRDCLPRWHQVSFLAVDNPGALEAGDLDRIVTAAALVGPVVLDLARWPSPVRGVALARCDQTILVAPAEVRGVSASAAVAAGLDLATTSVAVRGSSRNLPAERIGELLGLPVIAELPYDPASRRPTGLDLRNIRRPTRRMAERVLRRCLAAGANLSPAAGGALAAAPGSGGADVASTGAAVAA